MRRDGKNGLRVDFTLDEATPPVALEITALAMPEVMALGNELLKLEVALRKIVQRERLGVWILGVRIGTSVHSLKGPLTDFLRAHQSEVGAAWGVPDGHGVPSDLVDLGLVAAVRTALGMNCRFSPSQ